MSREIEVKHRLDDATGLRQRLVAAGAVRDALAQEVNHILDTPERRLLNAGCGLRIRSARPVTPPGPAQVTLTFKGPRDAALAQRGIKAREELETAAADEATLLAVFARLGFAPVIMYEKRRETWHWPDCVATIDELPLLGWFVELEADDQAALLARRAQLGLTDASAVDETYVRLADRHGTLNPAGVRELRFSA